jgi:hypothetical protein
VLKKKLLKELNNYPKKSLVERVLELETQLSQIKSNHKKATTYLKYALRRLNPNKKKIGLQGEFVFLYQKLLKGKTHDQAAQQLLSDPVWLFLCQLDPMLARLKSTKAIMNKFNRLKKVKSQKK